MIISPLEASATFATIVGLICNWKNERAAQATDRYQDFMKWLVRHNFNDLNDRIFASEELQRDLSALLSQDISVISTKLDTIVGSLSAVADKIDTLSQLGRTLGADTELLSEQSVIILKAFDQIQANRMVYDKARYQLSFFPSRRTLTLPNQRFAEYDLKLLQKFNFIELSEYLKNGQISYIITRRGSDYAQQLPEIPL